MTLSLLSGAGKVASANGWYVLNNVWNPGPLIEGRDYSISSTYTPGNLASGTTLNWSFPVVNSLFPVIRAYPEVIFGAAPHAGGGTNPADIDHVLPLQVGSITGLNANYSVSYGGNTQGYNVAFDLWFTSNQYGGASTITNEVMIWLHKGGLAPFGTAVGLYSDANFTGTIYHAAASNYTALISSSDLTSGTIDIGAMVKTLQTLGIVSANEYLADIELGAEVVSGAGTLTVNNLSFGVQSKSPSGVSISKTLTGTGVTAATITGGPANDTLVATAGKDTVNGGAGIDTFLLSGLSTSYSLIRNPGGTTTVARGGVTDTLTNVEFVTFADRTMAIAHVAVARDFNGDGTSDILWQAGPAQLQNWTIADGAAAATVLTGNLPSAAWHAKGTGDFNGDGRSDILLQDDNGQAVLWLMNGDTKLYAGSVVNGQGQYVNNPGNIWTQWHVMGAGDFNGDGRSDILWRKDDGQLQIWMMNGSTLLGSRSLAGPSTGWTLAGIGDFNGDGTSDLLWQNAASQIQVWTMNAGQAVSGVLAGNIGAAWHIKATADFNGDGKSDLLLQADNGQVGLWLMNGAKPVYAGAVVYSGGKIANNPGAGWSVAGAGDYNGDGKADILWQNSIGKLQVWTMNGNMLLGTKTLGTPAAGWTLAAGLN